jgi:hypothetical protein
VPYLAGPIDSPDTILAIIFTTVYATDVLLNFFVAYYDQGELVTDLRRIAGGCVVQQVGPGILRRCERGGGGLSCDGRSDGGWVSQTCAEERVGTLSSDLIAGGGRGGAQGCVCCREVAFSSVARLSSALLGSRLQVALCSAVCTGYRAMASFEAWMWVGGCLRYLRLSSLPAVPLARLHQ